MKFLSISDVKLFSANSAALAVSYTTVSESIKLLILLLTLGYTINKWYIMVQKNKQGKQIDED